MNVVQVTRRRKANWIGRSHLAQEMPSETRWQQISFKYRSHTVLIHCRSITFRPVCVSAVHLFRALYNASLLPLCHVICAVWWVCILLLINLTSVLCLLKLCYTFGTGSAYGTGTKYAICNGNFLLLLLLVVVVVVFLFTAIELSLGGSSPYTSTDKTYKSNIHKRNNTITQYKQ